MVPTATCLRKAEQASDTYGQKGSGKEEWGHVVCKWGHVVCRWGIIQKLLGNSKYLLILKRSLDDRCYHHHFMEEKD